MTLVGEALLNFVLFVMLILVALLTDRVLHLAGQPDWGRHLGYWGTAILALSFVYSARKRKLIALGRVSHYLRAHEFLTWLGAMMILVHGGIHFAALLPWLAMAALLTSVASGLTGKYLLKRSNLLIAARRRQLSAEGLTAGELEDRLHLEMLLLGLMRKWRVVHMPITTVFLLLTALHVASVLAFWNW